MRRFQKFCHTNGNCWKQIFFPLFLAVILGIPACAPAGGDAQHPESKEGVLTYAALNRLTSLQKKALDDFNKKHEDIQIEVVDYSDEGGVERLMTELALGWVPDIMDLHRFGSNGDDRGTTGGYIADRKASEGEYWLPYRQMAHKGYLEDLWPYIENDPKLGRDGLLEAPVKAAEVDGGLYILFREVYINTLIGAESVVGNRDGWTIEDLLESFSAMPVGSTIMRFNATRWEMYSNLFCTTLSQYIDWDSGECSFDNDEFRSMLAFLSTFPVEFKTTLSPSQVKEELVWRKLEGEQMLDAVMLVSLEDIVRQDLYFGTDRVAYVGYPTADGSSGSFFHIHGTTLAMSSVCQNKEAAWEFMSYLVRKVYSASAIDKIEFNWLDSPDAILIPVNRKSFENAITACMKRPKRRVSPVSLYPGGPRLTPKEITEEDAQRYRNVVNNTSQIYWPDDALSETVWDAIGPYFAGDKTLDETIQLVQNRVQLYVNENR